MTWITGHKDVRLHVRTAGNPGNPPILLIHGWSQHSLCWRQQFESLADRYYLVAPDLRGHGQSSKPLEPQAYDRSEPWADDIAALISQLKLEKPLLVGWSMGGWIVGDYLRHHGPDAISGITLSGSSITTGRKTPHGAAGDRDHDVQAPGMLSDDLAENIEATIRFVRACTADPLPAEVFAEVVGLNMVVPTAVRAACRNRHEDYRDLTIPMQVLWGDQERLAVPPYINEMLDVIPNAEAACLTGLGHAPFLEDPARFNAVLAEFADRVFMTHPKSRIHPDRGAEQASRIPDTTPTQN